MASKKYGGPSIASPTMTQSYTPLCNDTDWMLMVDAVRQDEGYVTCARNPQLWQFQALAGRSGPG